MPKSEKIVFKIEVSCLKWTVYNGRRKVFVNYSTDSDNLNLVIYRYRHSTYLKGVEKEMSLTE